MCPDLVQKRCGVFNTPEVWLEYDVHGGWGWEGRLEGQGNCSEPRNQDLSFKNEVSWKYFKQNGDLIELACCTDPYDVHGKNELETVKDWQPFEILVQQSIQWFE